MRVLPSGRDAVMLELDDGAEVLAYLAGLAEAPLAGVVEAVPAARTLLLRGASPRAMPGIVAGVRSVVPLPARSSSSGEVTIETTYDGEDLAEAARHLGMSPQALAARHAELTWTVAFCGFSPGFAYMTCPDAGWSMPRRASPRTRVPAGSVALAGEYTGCYPTPSPGGWQLIGRTDARLWDTQARPPALLTPGTRVRFVATGAGA